MIIAYDTRTGNTKRFCQKLGYDYINVVDIKDNDNNEFILVTYTTGLGEIPQNTINFINKHHNKIKGVICSGNRNWGNNFAKAGDIIAHKLKIPLLLKFELSGTDADVKLAKNKIKEII